MIAKLKTHFLEEVFLSLKSYQNEDVENGLA
jgi:hypothetical protein